MWSHSLYTFLSVLSLSIPWLHYKVGQPGGRAVGRAVGLASAKSVEGGGMGGGEFMETKICEIIKDCLTNVYTHLQIYIARWGVGNKKYSIHC